MGTVVELCRGHLCPECKQFWRHGLTAPRTAGFPCDNELTMTTCPKCFAEYFRAYLEPYTDDEWEPPPEAA